MSDDEKALNTNSAVACVIAIVAGTVLVALGHAEHAAIPFAFAFGVAALPQPIRNDR